MIALVIAAVIAAEVLLIIFLPAAGWSVLAFLVFLLLLILLIPLGVHVCYIDSKFELSARVYKFDIKLLPKKEKKNKPESPEKEDKPKQTKSKPSKSNTKKPGFSFEEILELAKKALKALGKFGKLTVDRFLLHYVAAGTDPYKTATTFGYVNTALSSLAPLCRKTFRVKNNVDVWTRVDFVEEKTKLDAELSITLRIIQLLHVALVLCFGAVPVLIKHRRRLKKKSGMLHSAKTNLI